MPKFKDFTGQVFGFLTAICRVENDSKGRTRWLCRCVCGKEKIVLANNLKQGKTKSCGCIGGRGRRPKEIISGTRFGHLVIIKSVGVRVLKYGENKFVKRQYVLCQCDCGNMKDIALSSLQIGVKTCGCGKRGKGAK